MERPDPPVASAPNPALNIELPGCLEDYLRARGALAPGEKVECRPLPGGVSNRTVWVTRAQPPHLVVKQALSKLRVAVDWFSHPRRIHREFAALEAFGRLLPGQVPRPVFQDRERHVIGMTAIAAPHANWKTRMMQGDVDAALWSAFGALLGHAHLVSRQNRQTIAQALWDRTFFETLRVEPYYRYSGTVCPVAQPFLHELIRDMNRLQATLVHGDFSPKNVLLHDGRLHLLDFEVCHVGDPAFDVGFALAHALSKAHRFPQRRAAFLNCALTFWRAYEASGVRAAFDADLERRSLRHAVACLLARAVGRSPLEYLDAERRARQAQVAASLMQALPLSMEYGARIFVQRIAQDAVA